MKPSEIVRNLSIACEALSRVNGLERELEQIKSMLQVAFEKTQEELSPPQVYTHKDDEIPF